MTKTGNEATQHWGLKPIILAWIIPILLANILLGVVLNYYMAKENDRKRIEDHILQRRMDLVFLTNLPDLRIYFMDLKLELKEEAEFVKEDVQVYLSNYLKNLKPSFPHVLSVVSLQGEELVRIKDGAIDYRDLSGSPFLNLFTQGQEQMSWNLPAPVLPESSWHRNSTLRDMLPIFDEINNRVIGGVIYEYNVPITLLTEHTRQVLIFNLALGLSIGACALLVLYFALGNIIKPLNRLTIASQEILTGDLSKEITVQGWGETSILATTFETMRQRLKSQFEQLEDNTRKLGAIIDFLPDATFVVDREGRVISWNLAMEALTGVKAEDILGKGDYEYAIPFYGGRMPILIDLVSQPQEGVENQYEKIVRGSEGKLVAETYVPNLKGSSQYHIATAAPLYDHKKEVVGAIQSIRDITERKRMEKAVAEAEAKYRSIFENAVTGIYQTTLEGRFLSVNKAFARILGYDSPQETLNTVSDISRQIYVNPERRAEMLRLIEERDMVQEFEVQLFKKDKSVAWITLNIRAVRDANRKIIHLEGTAQDITESKLLESQLNQARKMEAIGTLAGGIAHDFNNILAPIIGYSELLLNTVPKDSRLHHQIEQILLSGNRAKELVKQILTFSRKTEQERKPVQVSLVIKEALKLLRSSLPSTIEIRQNFDKDAFYTTVMADPTQIHQVLMNLCTNSAQAMREKGGVLSITLKNEDIDYGARKELADLEHGSYLRLSIADTGDGIDETIRRRIFDPYFTTKGPSEGTGLGLAVVYGIVKNLSGGITVSSKPGDGTTFDVYFPGTKTIQASAVDMSESLPTGKGLVLVVDDEKSIVDMLKEMLGALGYEVAGRYSSSDALQAFKEHPESFDLVVTDLTMPHMTGIDLAREIGKIRADTPIILCTGFSEGVDENRAKLLGISGFLIKPVAIRDLAAAVNKILVEDKPIT